MVRRVKSLLAAVVLTVSVPLVQGAAIERRPVQFAKGASSATVKGTIKGDQTIDYVLRAKARQTMRVKLDTRHTALYFNVLPPGSETALHVGSTSGAYKRVLKFSGNTVSTDGTVKATKRGDEWSVEVNDFEKYRIPEAVLKGG